MSAPAHHFQKHHEPTTEHMTRVLHLQQGSFAQISYPPLDLRLSFLDALKSTLIENQQDLILSIQQDYGIRSQDETKLAEIMTSVSGIRYLQKHLSDWMKPKKRKVPLQFQPSANWVFYQPKGIVGIMVPWNYPLYLAIEPLATAIAAGNRVMLKLSENTPKFNECFMHLLKHIFTDDWVCAFEGGLIESQYFSSLAFDHLFFTGSTAVGQQIMQAASRNLTPVTLELGGKSPCIVTRHADIALAAERIIFGKAFNAGQTCVAPDYLLVEASVKDELIQALQYQYHKNYGNDISQNPDYSSIINQQQTDRLQHLYQNAVNQGADALALAKGSLEQRRLPVTLFLNVNDSMDILQQEIFGPWLPIIEVCDLRQALHDITARPKPLALYLFSKNKAEQESIQKLSQSGGLCINDTLVHLAQDDLPFGGIGHSGMGNYHGKEGFLTLSHAKGIHKKGKFNAGSWILPPYNKKIHKFIYQWLIR
jgi:coniferyl-aldehyde dehydrogenase